MYYEKGAFVGEAAPETVYTCSKMLIEKELSQCRSTDEIIQQFKAMMREVEETVIAEIYQFREKQAGLPKIGRDDLLEMKKELEQLNQAYMVDKKGWKGQALKSMCEGIENELSQPGIPQMKIELNSSEIVDAIKSTIFVQSQKTPDAYPKSSRQQFNPNGGFFGTGNPFQKSTFNSGKRGHGNMFLVEFLKRYYFQIFIAYSRLSHKIILLINTLQMIEKAKSINSEESPQVAYSRCKNLLQNELKQCRPADELVEEFKAVMQEVQKQVIDAIYKFKEEQIKEAKIGRDSIIEMQEEIDRLKFACEGDKIGWREQGLKSMWGVITSELSKVITQKKIQFISQNIAAAIQSVIFKQAQILKKTKDKFDWNEESYDYDYRYLGERYRGSGRGSRGGRGGGQRGAYWPSREGYY